MLVYCTQHKHINIIYNFRTVVKCPRSPSEKIDNYLYLCNHHETVSNGMRLSLDIYVVRVGIKSA